MFGIFKKKTRKAITEVKKMENRDAVEATVWGAYSIAYADGTCDAKEIAVLEKTIAALPVFAPFSGEIAQMSANIRARYEASPRSANAEALRQLADVAGTGKRKTFVNTTLGETWEAKIGERPDAEVMAERKEHYSAPVPDRVAYLTAGIDSQLDRYEMRVWGWGPGEESWLIDRQIIMGRHDDEQTLLRVDEAINKTYIRRNGAEMSVSRICWDTGGIDPTIVYERSKKHGLFRVIPITG